MRRYECRAPWSNRCLVLPSAPHNPVCPAYCCRALPEFLWPTSWAHRQSAPTITDRVAVATQRCYLAALAHAGYRTHPLGDSAGHVALPLLAKVPTRYWHRILDVRFFDPTSQPSDQASPTYPYRFARDRANRNSIPSAHCCAHRPPAKSRFSCGPYASWAHQVTRSESRRRCDQGNRC